MSEIKETILRQLPRKYIHKLKDVLTSEYGCILVLKTGYIFPDTKDITYDIDALDKKRILNAMKSAYWIGCQNCLSRGTTRCNKMCDHFRERT